MNYKTLPVPGSSRRMTDVFRGYNHNLRISEGEMYDMKNMTSDQYPILAPREARGLYAEPNKVTGMIAKDTLCYVDGTDFVFDQYRVNMGLGDEPKQIVSMGAYVIIMPDKKYINTADITDRGNIEASVTTTGSVSFELCRVDGSAMNVAYRQTSEPDDPKNMDLWIDTSGKVHVLKQFSQSSGLWVSITTTYIKVSSTGIGTSFSKFDGVTISGLKDATLIDSTTGQTIEDSAINAIDGSFVIWDKGDDFIVIVGLLDFARDLRNAVTIKRTMPNMDFLVESENRLWGCRYGTNADGSIVNEIYASKLGDFKNWNCFMGVSTDSYVASCGTDGQFTGAITHLGHPCFFKETCLHKVYGNYPSNFSIQTTACRGVQKGSYKSLAIVNEVLFYKGTMGICSYDGSLPAEISADIGQEIYHNASSGAIGSKYYISMADSEEIYHLFVYDAGKKMWHKEDNLRADGFCNARDELYYIDHKDGKIYTALGSGTKAEEKVPWMVETGILTTDMPDKKYISRVNIRMDLSQGSSVRIQIEYDSSGTFVDAFTMNSTRLMSFSIPIRPRRCDHMRLKLIGEGPAKIYSITKTIEQGSDLR